MPDNNIIEAIRASSRQVVRELGFLNSTLAATNYSASAVHALLEIDTRKAVTAADLVQVLGLEKSSVSRMLGKLRQAGELYETISDEDARARQLQLTEQGTQTVREIHRYGRMRVEKALEHLNSGQQRSVADGLLNYAQALKACRGELLGDRTAEKTFEILTGYRPGVIGRVAEMHANYYSKHYNFGHFFEGKVASELAEFSGRLEQPCNRLWVVCRRGKIVGSVSIDGEDLGHNEAHLRWFILDDDCRGSGIGRTLLSEAMRFCDEYGFSAVQLWTVSGLNAARHLYESMGFELTREWQGEQWGSSMLEQQFTRKTLIAR
ncbi:helix-turn-helix domain-containing GNAT family N-acetyltransferase [Cedecea sp. P7760]|jgi:DNA-binding MarR family transcriptional regulator/N-acetylglutamate synthase-like GNAT family acetyltransferase|uniref:helix-turn-helix domain-containing GNAT family N-acetyltransferase n=1 Tax=Cedecea sp. P7760 TaxID=2726983 RepID=UPI0015A0C79E|nr:helix-turn-helix domain-containing GNAT family N-acetyltransferase [Cedecea sp. P7760]NWC64226.1 MarR family transcriptional regulator [Cedecea sp. P7760]